MKKIAFLFSLIFLLGTKELFSQSQLECDLENRVSLMGQDSVIIYAKTLLDEPESFNVEVARIDSYGGKFQDYIILRKEDINKEIIALTIRKYPDTTIFCKTLIKIKQ